MLRADDVARGDDPAHPLRPDRARSSTSKQHDVAAAAAAARPPDAVAAAGAARSRLLSVLEYRLSSLLLRVLGALFGLLPIRRGRVVLASARLPSSTATCARSTTPSGGSGRDAEVVLLLEPYGYGRAAKLRYLLRHDPGHVPRADGAASSSSTTPGCRSTWRRTAPGRPSSRSGTRRGAQAVRRRHARSRRPSPSATFLHRYYDWVVTRRGGVARTVGARPCERPSTGCSRSARRGPTTSSTRRGSRPRGRGRSPRYPALAGRRVVLYAPTFRGRGAAKADGGVLDPVRAPGAAPADRRARPQVTPEPGPGPVPTDGFDVVAVARRDMNDLLALADVLVTDYSSSVFEFALLRRPIVLVVPDLEAYERDPGLYLDLRTDLVGTLVRDTDAAAAAITAAPVDEAAYDAFIARNLGGCDGHAAERIVERFPA